MAKESGLKSLYKVKNWKFFKTDSLWRQLMAEISVAQHLDIKSSCVRKMICTFSTPFFWEFCGLSKFAHHPTFFNKFCLYKSQGTRLCFPPVLTGSLLGQGGSLIICVDDLQLCHEISKMKLGKLSIQQNFIPPNVSLLLQNLGKRHVAKQMVWP